jgi:hypothetical protein
MKWLNTRCTIAETIQDRFTGDKHAEIRAYFLLFISASSFKWTTEFREIS